MLSNIVIRILGCAYPEGKWRGTGGVRQDGYGAVVGFSNWQNGQDMSVLSEMLFPRYRKHTNLTITSELQTSQS